MQIEAIGLIALTLGCLGWLAGPGFAICVFLVSDLLGAAGAIILTSFGSANIPPAHLLLGFIAVSSVAKRETLRIAARAVAFPNAGFWLLLTAIYAVLSAIFLPRLFAGATYVFAVSRTEIGPGIVSIPLAPTSGNITQMVYFLGDIVCFLVFYTYACRLELLKTIVRAALTCAAFNLVFVLLDLATYWSHTEYLLSPIRNASYRMLENATINGFKRIVGSFAEASGFAYATLGWFAFCTRLWLANVHPRLTGPLALLSLCAIIFSTSSTGYAGALGCLAALFLINAARVLTRPVPRSTFAFVMVAPLLIPALLIGLRLNQPAWTVVEDMVDKTLVDKLASDSGKERMSWNEQALTNFVETQGLGAGVGSVRASSLPLAVLGNIGAIGALTYGIFLFRVLVPRRDRWRAPYPAACQSAARWACFAQLVGAFVSASFIDLALPFFIFAGLACAGPEPARSPQMALAGRPLAAVSS